MSNNNLANGTHGVYDFHIKAILKEAWQKTYGIKATYWKAFFLALLTFIGVLVVLMGVGFLIGLSVGLLRAPDSTVEHYTNIVAMISEVLMIFPTAPLTAGILMLGLKHCMGEEVHAKAVFDYYPLWQRLWVLPFIAVVINVATDLVHGPENWQIVVQVALQLFYVYIMVSYAMFPLLIAEKKLEIWPALEASRKAISYHWFKMLWFFILILLIILGSILTLGILLIWTAPMINNAYAILYREMFGVEKTSLQTLY